MSIDDLRAIAAVVAGRVQGVSFRAWTERTAVSLGLAGWVRNRTDGAVELEAQGEPLAVAKLLEALHRGPPAARVDTVAINDIAVNPDRRGFSIRR